MGQPGGWGSSPGRPPFGGPAGGVQPQQWHGQPYPPPAPERKRPGRRRVLLWAGAGAAVLVVVVALVVAVVVANLPGSGENSKGSGVALGGTVRARASSLPSAGGPFLDPVGSQPVEVWRTTPEALAGGGWMGAFVTANEKYALVDVQKDGADVLVLVDAANGGRIWSSPYPLDGNAVACEIAEDARAVCWKDDLNGRPPTRGEQPSTITLAFLGPEGKASGTATLAHPGAAVVRAVKGGFLVFQGVGPSDWDGKDIPAGTATLFSTSGQQLWTQQTLGASGYGLKVSVQAGLFQVGTLSHAEVRSLDDGRAVSDPAEILAGSSDDTSVHADLFASGFVLTAGRKLFVYDSKGAKTAELDDWRLRFAASGSSTSCGKLLVSNDEGQSAAVEPDGRILWQQPIPVGGLLPSMACEGDYVLVRPASGGTGVEVYELATGKHTGTLPLGGTSTLIVGADGANILATVDSTSQEARLEAYSLATGQRLWSMPARGEGVIEYSGQRGGNGGLMGGGVYRFSRDHGYLVRLGQKA